MKVNQFSNLAFAAGLALSLLCVSALTAQAATQDVSASDGVASKQEKKTQKKAASKERRAKKNAELSTLEKNGYNPAGNQTNYPQNLESAQKKAAGQNSKTSPAVAP
ncbi:DUF4148 domain-containing protein [Paraburkholderia metrosideri]|jgi:hypothetical protein|uniref:DUF4148 domain-containing protein n=1 Tax=Paraburkholderia metrosideri TaxID=580937 RepID=A0ABM8NQW1_9BURK|nr:DUF4148 domain-containing protein [Paraburkholderia metrosideri]CAD6538922.1 hypothetical protein LMG28140_03314 [Paraburkholderia metrosideri]